MKFGCLLTIAVLVAYLAPGRHAMGQSSYLRKGDAILTIGDSVTAQGVFQDHMQQLIDALYPGAGIKVINSGSGGKGAGSGIGPMKAVTKGGRITIVAVMYGVNDTGWSAAGMDAKTAAFVGNLTRIIELAKARGVNLIFLRETHFSHNAKKDAWVDGITAALEVLLKAQDELAAKHGVPVIDVLGAYRKALAKAWAKDPLYEFTPDVIHPTQPGHAAMATEVLRAMGVGLPLAAGKRGPLRVRPDAPVTLGAADAVGIVKEDGSLTIQVRCRNTSKNTLKGKLTIVVGGYKDTKPAEIASSAAQTLSFKVPAVKLTGRWAVLPIYMVFQGGGLFAAEHTLLHYSRIAPPGKPVAVTAKDFGGDPKRPCPVSRAAISCGEGGVKVEFQWTDSNTVLARPGFKHRFGYTVKAPLDLGAREGQPCDAVEFLFDLRAHDSAGRYTSNVDSNPKGVVRLGVYRTKAGGKAVARLLAPPEVPAGKAALIAKEKDTYVLDFKMPSKAPTLGFSMRVTDADDFRKGRLFRLTGRTDVVHEPMSYIRMSAKKSGIFFRVGY